uniref:Uncharacterized protein n=1 Tax=Arundo donax TaxID=35708 RepID=A0A0A9FAZ2_ARUDO
MEEAGLAPPPVASLTRIRKASRYW